MSTFNIKGEPSGTPQREVAPRGVTDTSEFPDLPEARRRVPAVESPSAVPTDDAGQSEEWPLSEQPVGEHFHCGENVPILASDFSSAAVEAAGRVAENLQGSNERIISAGEEVADAKARFEPAVYNDTFIPALVARNVLTKRDGELRGESAKLSKLLAIGQSADILRHPEIFPRLPNGYSGIYEALLLLRKLPGDETAQTASLIEHLIEAERRQDVSRQFLADRKRELKPPRQEPAENPPVTSADGVADFTKPSAVSICKADLILVTPSNKDIDKLKCDVTESSLPACRRLEMMAADKCDVVAIVPLHAMATVQTKMFDESGFLVERVLLLHRPDAPDVTDAEVAIFAARGAGDRNLGHFEWAEDLDHIGLAERLFPESRNKLHVFADRAEGDWVALVGDDNWRTEW